MSVAYRAPESDPVASAAVATEATTRAAADTAEASARAAADAADQAAIAAEAVARGADVDDEMTRAEAAEAAEIAARAAAVSAEATSRVAQDAVLAAVTSSEASTRATADTALANADAAETSARQAAVTAEAAARDAAIATHAGLKRGVHGIPSSVGAGLGLVGDGSGGWSAVDVATQAELDAEATARGAADALLVPLSQKGAASGVASLGTDTVVPQSQLAKAGIYLPPDFGGFWRTARATAAAGSGRATIAIVGDSIGRGIYSSNIDTKGWAALLRTSLQSAYGDGGFGFKGVRDSVVLMTSDSVSAAARTAYAAQLVTTTGGTWAEAGALGPATANLGIGASGATLTFPAVRGTSITLYYLTNTTLGSFTWTIDGVAQGSVNTNAAAGVAKVTVSGLSAGTHTVVVTTSSATAVYISGVEGRNASGVLLNNLSRPGGTSAHFADTTSFGGVAQWSGGINYPADLIIYSLGVNDVTTNVAGDTWAKNVRKYLGQVRNATGSSGAQDVIFVLPHIGNWDATNFVYQDYLARARGLAEAYGAALVDFWRIGRNSWPYWNSLSYWAVADGTGGAGTDTVHLSDAGHQAMHDTLLPILTA